MKGIKGSCQKIAYIPICQILKEGMQFVDICAIMQTWCDIAGEDIHYILVNDGRFMR